MLRHQGAAKIRRGRYVDGALVALDHHVDHEGCLGLREPIRCQMRQIEFNVAARDRFQMGLEIAVADVRLQSELADHFQSGRDRPRVGGSLEHIALIDEPGMVDNQGRRTDRHHRHHRRDKRGRSRAGVVKEPPHRRAQSACRRDAPCNSPCGTKATPEAC